MATQIYDLKEQEIEKLKEAFYEVESYKTIMIELCKDSSNGVFENSIFNDFRKQYKEALISYEKEKINFEFDFVKIKHPNATHWNVTFGDNKVEIRYPS